MKKGIIILGIAAALFTLSCSKISPAGENESKTKVTLGAALEQQTSETKTALVTGNVLWSANDKLSVLSAANYAGGDVFTLQSAFAGQASGQFDGELTEADEYYALYPYSELATYSNNEITFPVASTQEYVAGGFSNGANASVAPFSYATKNNLNFKNIFGVLKLSLKAASDPIAVDSIMVIDNAGKLLNGTAKITTANIKSGELNVYLSKGNKKMTLTFNTAKTITSSEASDFYFVIPSGAFANGFIVKVYSGEECRTVSTIKDNTIKRSIIRAMPEFTLPASADTAIDLSESGNANCYIVPTITTTAYKFIATKKGNETTSSLTPVTAELVWETENTATTITTDHIVTDVNLNSGYVTFKATGKSGNALIDVRDETGEILWSWHIWCVSDLTEKGPLNNGGYCLDRAIGALSSEKDNLLVTGLLYQWGRKDPFPGTSNYKDNVGCFSLKYYNGFAFYNPKTKCADVATSIKTPTTLYATSTGWLNTDDDTLWGIAKTIYDPCPVGYKVAPNGTWTGLIKEDSWDYGYTLLTNTTPNVNLGFFPAGGLIFNVTGYLGNVGKCNYTWSSFSTDGIAKYLSCDSGDFKMSTTHGKHSTGMSVRCCKE